MMYRVRSIKYRARRFLEIWTSTSASNHRSCLNAVQQQTSNFETRHYIARVRVCVSVKVDRFVSQKTCLPKSAFEQSRKSIFSTQVIFSERFMNHSPCASDNPLSISCFSFLITHLQVCYG